MRTILAIAIGMSLAVSVARAQNCLCEIRDASVDVKNFPETQRVMLTGTTSPVQVTDVDAWEGRSLQVNLGAGEKRPLGPFSLRSKKRAILQVTQIEPRTPVVQPVVFRWYVRFTTDDAFFDPCLRETPTQGCSAGLSPGGTRLRPLPTPVAADRLEGYAISNAVVTIQTFDLLGEEGLLVVENQAGPRTLSVQIVFED